MTEERVQQEAEQYAIESTYMKGSPDFWATMQAYIAGHKKGYNRGLKENAIQWHDLRKDPNDLPAKGQYVLNQDGSMVKYCNQGNLEWLYCAAPNDELYHIAEVLLWCEIPTY